MLTIDTYTFIRISRSVDSLSHHVQIQLHIEEALLRLEIGGGADHSRSYYFRLLVAKWASSACLKSDIASLPSLLSLLGDKHHPRKAARSGDRVWEDRPRAPPNKDESRVY